MKQRIFIFLMVSIVFLGSIPLIGVSKKNKPAQQKKKHNKKNGTKDVVEKEVDWNKKLETLEEFCAQFVKPVGRTSEKLNEIIEQEKKLFYLIDKTLYRKITKLKNCTTILTAESNSTLAYLQIKKEETEGLAHLLVLCNSLSEDEGENSILHRLVEKDKFVGYLSNEVLDQFDLNKQNKEGMTPFLNAVKVGNHKAVDKFIAYYKQIDKKVNEEFDFNFEKRLNIVSQLSKQEIVCSDEEELKSNVKKNYFDIKKTDFEGNNPLHVAAISLDKNMLKRLIELKYWSCFEKNKNGFTPSTLKKLYEVPKEIKDLADVKDYAELSIVSIQKKRNELFDILKKRGKGGGELEDFVKENKEYINTLSEDEKKIFFDFAIVYDSIPRIKILIEDFGINPSKHWLVAPSLWRAAEKGNFDLVKFLLEKGAGPKALFGGQTILHLALRGGWSDDIIELLLDAGADIRMKNKNGITSFEASAVLGNDKVKELFWKKYIATLPNFENVV